MSKGLLGDKVSYVDVHSALYGSVYVHLDTDSIGEAYQLTATLGDSDKLDFVTSVSPVFDEDGVRLSVSIRALDRIGMRYLDEARKATLFKLLAPKYTRAAVVTARVMRNGDDSYKGTLVDLRFTGDEKVTGKELRELLENGIEGVQRARVTESGRAVVFSLQSEHRTDVDGEITKVARRFADALRTRLSGDLSVQDSNPDADLLLKKD